LPNPCENRNLRAANMAYICMYVGMCVCAVGRVLWLANVGQTLKRPQSYTYRMGDSRRGGFME